MPDPSKVRWAQLKAGVLGIAALVVLAVLIFLLTGNSSIFTPTFSLRTYMDDASGLATGAAVRLNGILVGTTDEIKLSGSQDPKRAVEFDMTVNSKYLNDIPEDSTAAISAANLLGDKFINITRGKSPRHVRPGAELKSLQVQDIPELMAQSAGLIASLQDIVTRADRLLLSIDQGNGNIGKLLKDEELYNRLNGIASEGQKILADVRNGKGTISKLIYDDSLYQEIRAPLHRLDAVVADLQSGQGSAGKFLHDPVLYDEAQKSLAELRRLVQDLNAGKGTAGKLVKDDELYKQINVLVSKLDGTINKMNSGQGTLGQLLINPQLYESLTGVTREFQSLAKDMRTNPKKFLTIRLTLF